jgi:hypothetical protein
VSLLEIAFSGPASVQVAVGVGATRTAAEADGGVNDGSGVSGALVRGSAGLGIGSAATTNEHAFSNTTADKNATPQIPRMMMPLYSAGRSQKFVL